MKLTFAFRDRGPARLGQPLGFSVLGPAWLCSGLACPSSGWSGLILLRPGSPGSVPTGLSFRSARCRLLRGAAAAFASEDS